MKLEINSKLITLPEFEDDFGLTDEELMAFSRQTRSYIGGDIQNITRLTTLYLLHIPNKKVREEFVEYLDEQSLDYVVSVLKSLTARGLFDQYFVHMMPTQNVVDYVRQLRTLDLSGNQMSKVFTEAMQRYTKNYDHEIVSQLVEMMETYRDAGKNADWISAVVPYGKDWLLAYVEGYFEYDDMLRFIYDTALENSEQRLSYIVDYISKYRSYDDQLKVYIDDIEFTQKMPPNYGVIVMMLAKKLGKSLVDLDFPYISFQAWKLKVLDGQV